MEKYKEEKILEQFRKDNPDVAIKFIDTFTKAASYNKQQKVVKLSKAVYKHNPADGLKALLAHEKAHFKVYNHSKAFKEEIARLGGDEKKIVPITKYVLICPVCRHSCLANQIKKGLLYFCTECNAHGKEINMVWYEYVNSQDGLREPETAYSTDGAA
jgi:predicted SprT family Zn-dependent metalloprotease